MIRTFLTWLLLAGVAATLAACCGSVSCDCQDGSADAVTLRFDLDSAQGGTGFTSAALDSIYLRRVPLNTTQQLKTDSVLLVRPRSTPGLPLVINRNRPFPPNGTRKLSEYRYVIRLAGQGTQYSIDQIQLAGNFRADGCCTCYRNTKKIVHFRNRLYDQTVPGQNDVVISR
ncbi:hypothetical protein GCM10022408_33960 [Hymenobacter fastidiosus]|uniref:Lipoprotein n=1 Tax=Hymenobacter fastidiosus TaxID=486264 RepID=A0ABP7SWJ4_9BACT